MNCGNRFQVLCHDQVKRLDDVVQGDVQIHGRGNFPTLDVKLKDLIRAVRNKLEEDEVSVRDIRLNGGAASYVLGTESVQTYNDVDLIFGVDLPKASQHEMMKIKNCVLNCLLDFLPKDVNKNKMSTCSLKEAYVQKMVKVCNETGDRWSLISLSNNKGRNVELKFVDKMKRQFEFSVDSFQIILDSLLTFYDVSQTSMSEHFYPTVVAESVFGDFAQALYHLNEKLIATRNPEEIRGGGLLKYCNLLVRGYDADDTSNIAGMQRYMCSRFFIDFSDLLQQKRKLESYLTSHFIGEEHLKHNYLLTLYRVVDESTICLMGHERRQTLNLIHQFACRVLMTQERKVQNKYLDFQQFEQLSNLVIDQVYYHHHPFPNSNGGCSNGYSFDFMPNPVYQVSGSSNCHACLQCS